MQILGFPIDNLERSAITSAIVRFLDEPVFHRIVTINPEFILLAQKNREFARTLSEADVRIADAVGISLAFRLIGEKLLARYPGADLMHEVVELAQARHQTVYVATRTYGLSSFEEVRAALSKRYPGLKVIGKDYTVFEDNQPITEGEVVLCNFGIPDQEIFLANLARNPGPVRLAIGIGGSFDYLTGKVRRAPVFLQRLGLEWLWRLMLQPWRLKRMWNAVVIFPYRVWQEKKASEGKKKTEGDSPFITK